MFVWFKKTKGFSELINVQQIVRIEPSGESGCVVYLADGQKIDVEHSIVGIEKTLVAEVIKTSIPRVR
jgi:hypothetical protein